MYLRFKVMKYGIIYLLLICYAAKAYCQQPVKIDLPLPPDTSKTNAMDSTAGKRDTEPDFNGGKIGWMRFLERNLNANVPYEKGAPKGTYTVVIEFLVYEDGTIDKLKPLTQHGYGMEDEVVRILKKAPKWKPAIKDGKAKQAYRKQTVAFAVQ